MKLRNILFCIVSLIFSDIAIAQNSKPMSIPGVIYVQFKTENVHHFLIASPSPSPSNKVSIILKKIGVTSIKPFDIAAKKDSISKLLGIDRIAVVNYDSAVEPIDVVRELLATGEIETASPRYAGHYDIFPNDTLSTREY